MVNRTFLSFVVIFFKCNNNFPTTKQGLGFNYHTHQHGFSLSRCRRSTEYESGTSEADFPVLGLASLGLG